MSMREKKTRDTLNASTHFFLSQRRSLGRSNLKPHIPARFFVCWFRCRSFKRFLRRSILLNRERSSFSFCFLVSFRSETGSVLFCLLATARILAVQPFRVFLFFVSAFYSLTRNPFGSWCRSRYVRVRNGPLLSNGAAEIVVADVAFLSTT